MIASATLDRLLEQVLADGPGSVAQLIAADAADDAGQYYLAECLRWMHQRRSYPCQRAARDEPWTWWTAQDMADDKEDKLNSIAVENIIPISSWGRLESRLFQSSWYWHKSAEEAIRAFWLDWVEAREKGWKPVEKEGGVT